jgi:hypothetical protein
MWETTIHVMCISTQVPTNKTNKPTTLCQYFYTQSKIKNSLTFNNAFQTMGKHPPKVNIYFHVFNGY